MNEVSWITICYFFRFLATGESFRSLAFQFRICHSWISKIIRQVAESIVTRMLTLVMPQPTEEMFKTISRKYRSLWDFPNCVGAIDGKHIRIKAPKNSGSTFFNYKEFYSVVMLAIVDADNKFVAVDIGSYGRGDAGKLIIINVIFKFYDKTNFNFRHIFKKQIWTKDSEKRV